MNEQSGLPAWCPPIPEGWEVMTKDTYRGGIYDLACEGEAEWSPDDPLSEEVHGEPWWQPTAIYIQPKQERKPKTGTMLTQLGKVTVAIEGKPKQEDER